MQPSDLRKAIETLGDDNRQKKTWLDGIGLSLTTSGLIAANPTPDPRTYKQHIDGLISTNRALQQKLTSLQGDLQRLKDELVQAQAQRNALESEVQFHREQERARAHGANAYSYQDPPAGEPAGGGGFAPYSGPNWPPGGNNV
jgi:FtsZ-binding cell division protein ZapB